MFLSNKFIVMLLICCKLVFVVVKNGRKRTLAIPFSGIATECYRRFSTKFFICFAADLRSYSTA